MGIGIFPVYEPPVREANFESDGKLLLSALPDLDEVACSHGLTPMSSFADNRPVPEDFIGEPADLNEILGPWEQWFSVDEGIRCIEGLASVLRTRPEARSLIGDPDEVIEELDYLAACLQVAQRSGAWFRLEVG